MISIEVCRKTLNKGKNNYTDKEIETIREFLYKMAKIAREELNIKNNGRIQNCYSVFKS